MNILYRNMSHLSSSAIKLTQHHEWKLWISNKDNVIITTDSTGKVEMVVEMDSKANTVLTAEVVRHIDTRYHMGQAYVMNKAYLNDLR